MKSERKNVEFIALVYFSNSAMSVLSRAVISCHPERATYTAAPVALVCRNSLVAPYSSEHTLRLANIV